jgi:hypothetical protein
VTNESVYNIQVTEQEKDLFQQWLKTRHNELLVELETVKSLLNKLPQGSNVTLYTEPARLTITGREAGLGFNPNPKWAEKSLQILKEHKKKMTSAEVVEILREKDPLSAQLPRIEVMRGVSSRLAQLVKRGQAGKQGKDGVMYYWYIKD